MTKKYEHEVGPGHHMPHECPNCHAVGTLVFQPWDTDDMTEGQASDYEAGLYGTAMCRQCGHQIEWGF